LSDDRLAIEISSFFSDEQWQWSDLAEWQRDEYRAVAKFVEKKLSSQSRLIEEAVKYGAHFSACTIYAVYHETSQPWGGKCNCGWEEFISKLKAHRETEGG